MAAPPDETQWFQWIIGIFVIMLTGMAGWLQKQIGQVKKDAELADGQLRSETLEAIRVLREEMNRRHDEERIERTRQYQEERADRARQHQENSTRMDKTDASIQRNYDAATVERQRFIDYLTKITEQLAKMATRDDVRTMIADRGPERRNVRGGDD
jgi:hypothetical protein